MKMSGGNNRLTVIMLIVFLLNAILPSISLAAFGPEKLGTTVTQTSDQDPMSAETVVICTPEGLKLVRWADLENGTVEEGAANGAPVRATGCLLCSLPTFGTAVTVILLVGLLDLLPEKTEKEAFPSIQVTVPYHLVDPQTFVRGPPAFA